MRHHTAVRALLTATFSLALLALGCGSDDDDAGEVIERTDVRPVIFVHGGAGSGAQFETQAMRFASNGYPSRFLRVLDYNSGNSNDPQIPIRMDDLVESLLAETGADRVDVLGHSLGTRLMQDYLADPVRASRVAHYVNIDGQPADALPGGVPTLALWAELRGDREIVGARNVYFLDQAHVEIATSRESFAEMFAFFNDDEQPATIDILPQRSEQIEIAGRAVHFPQNDGVPEGMLEIYEVDAATGYRLDPAPTAIYELSGDGAWGPFDADHGASYEMVIVRRPQDRLHHFYLQPIIRSDYLIRLNSSPADGGLAALVERSDDTTAFVFSRYKEWWGDRGERSDSLEIDGMNVLNPATSPASNNSIGVFVFDVDSDGVDNLDEPIAALFGLSFLTGMDLFVEAAIPPNRTVAVVNAPRGDRDRLQIVNVPNWASSGHAVSIHFQDFVQDSR
jgi:pimeloyl-ACP methyl ester carboxylesterase